MASPAAKVAGLSRLGSKLKQIPDAARLELQAAMERGADAVVALARSLVAKDSLALHNSIGWTWGQPPRGSISLGKMKAPLGGLGFTLSIYAGNDEAFYARWIEFGTSAHVNGGLFPGTSHPGTSAQPFFFPSWRANKKTVKNEMRKGIRRGVKKVAAS